MVVSLGPALDALFDFAVLVSLLGAVAFVHWIRRL